MPQIWTLTTCVLFEESIFFLLLHLLIANYFIRQLDSVWSPKQFIALTIVSSLLTSLFHLSNRYSMWALFERPNFEVDGYLNSSYNTLNHLVLIILHGCRQAYPERAFDTGIPFITKNVSWQFKWMPQLYLIACVVGAFIFEMDIDWNLFVSFFSIWFIMRFFSSTLASQ